MYRKANHILLTALTALLAACVESGAPDDSYADVNVAVDLALAVSPTTNRTVTRMAGDVVEGNGALEDLLVIPFTVKGSKIGLTDMPRTFSLSGVSTDTYTNKDGGASRFYYYKNCSFMAGTTSVLAYAQAKRSITGKVYDGSIASTGLETMTPANISFALESFVADNTAPAGAVTIVEALNELANVVRADRSADINPTNPTWSTTSNGSLQSLFKTFTWRDGSGTYTLLPGSSANMVCHLKEMKSRLAALSLTEGSTEAALRDALVAAIGSEGDDAATSIIARVAGVDYPRSMGLPDGAAALRWVDNVGGGAFQVETQTTTLASINNLSRYAYPPALMFYGNSEIYTSNEEVTESDYDGASTWSQVLAKYEYSNGTVSANTKAVAVIEPLQYAVGRLDFTLQKTATTTLKDGHGTDIDVGKTVEGNREETCFPLTGVVVGNQHTLGFDFVPPPQQTDFDTKFAYDSQVPTGASRIYLNTKAESAPVSTLSLQTYDGEEVYIGLEFENQSGVSFQGIDGVVYPGTRFYLIGSIKPTDGVGTGDAEGRVFTQDYTTKVSLKVASLAKAYNVLPDLLSARLEVGVMVSHWVAATPGEVILD